MNLSDRLKKTRDRRELTRKEAAPQIGISYSMLCLIEGGLLPGIKVKRKIDAWLYGKPKPTIQKEQPHAQERKRDIATA